MGRSRQRSEGATGIELNRPEGVMANHRKTPSVLADIAGFIQDLARSIFDPYRPELHYMRGPGPRWHAKNDRTTIAYRAIPALVPVRVRTKR
jgi:hypothetical protein